MLRVLGALGVSAKITFWSRRLNLLDAGVDRQIAAENRAQVRELPGHKRRKPQRWLGFSVEAPGIEDGAGVRPKSIVH
jgi:hypothetical protein